MRPRTKKLIGAIGLIVWLTFYALLVMRLAVAILPRANGLITLLFYAVAGIAWIMPIGLALPWMHRDGQPGKERDQFPSL